MEKHLFKINAKKALISVLILFIVSFSASSQNVSLVDHIRLNVWADIEVYPGVKQDKEYEGFEYPIKGIKEVAPFIINGMVYGWEFSYTPSDKTRGVKEYFEVTPIQSEEYVKQGITYSSPWIENNRLYCWVDFDKTDAQVQEYQSWSSINNPVISGKGYGPLKSGFEGIKIAAEEALKNAVRSYYRNVIKNKPKEIRGKVLIKDIPIIGLDAGRYVFNLDFFLECGKIIEYKIF